MITSCTIGLNLMFVLSFIYDLLPWTWEKEFMLYMYTSIVPKTLILFEIQVLVYDSHNVGTKPVNGEILTLPPW